MPQRTRGRTQRTGASRARQGARGTAAGGEVLCLLDDPDLRARVVAVCQEVAVTPDVPGHVPDQAAFAGAALVLLDVTAAGRVQGLPRRAGVVLVCSSAPVPVGAGRVEDPGSPGEEVWRAAVAAGAERVVVLPEAAGWLGEAVLRAVRPRGCCVGVVGARGGAGATSSAVALATEAAASGRRVLLLDLDPLGGGLDLAVGAEDLPGPRWPDLHDVRAPLPPGGLAAALPVADGVALLSYGREGVHVEPDAVRAVLRAALDEHDLVVVDLPRAGGGAAEAAVQALDVLVCVCPRELRAVAAAPAVLRRWGATAAVHLLVRGPAPGGLRGSDAAEAVRTGLGPTGPGWTGLARVDVVRPEPGLAAALERGEAFAVGARSPLRRWAGRWVAEELTAGAARAA